MILAGFNPDGAQSKMSSIRKLIRESKATIVTMQETKYKQSGQMKFHGFHTYEHLRSTRDGGGVALSVLKELNPSFVCDGGEDVEALTVDIHLKNMSISIVSAYGPLENALIQKKHVFWEYLSQQAHRAAEAGKGFIVQGDLNSWLGPHILPGDKRTQNTNGKLFQNFLENNKLICVNSLPCTKGLVTRRRKYLNEIRESTIDFYVVCAHVLPLISRMEILNYTDHNLTNYSLMNNNSEAVSSDHAPLVMEINLEAVPTKKNKIELPNFEDKDSQIKFRIATSETNVFTQCFESKDNVLKQCETWLSYINAHVKRSFKKIRIRPRKIRPSAADRLIGQRNKLIKQGKIEESKQMDVQIAIKISEEGRHKANMFRKYCDKSKSGVLSEMWQLKKKLFPKKASTLPSAKINYQGKIVTEPKELTKLIGEEYGRIRLRKRPCHPKNQSTMQTRNK